MVFVRKPRYTLDECYSALDIHPKTFRRWLADAAMQPERSRADERIKYLSYEQLEHLARTYDRPWPPQVDAREGQPELIPAQAYKLLLEQLAEAQQETQELRASLNTLSTGQEAQQARQQELTSQLATSDQEHSQQAEELAQRLYEHSQLILKRFETFTATNEMFHTMLRDTRERQEEASGRIETAILSIGRQQQELDILLTQAEKQRVTLDEAGATIEVQDQRLSDLEARLDQQAQRIDAGEKAQEAAHREQQQAEQHLSAQTRETEQRLHAQVQEAQEAAARSQEQALAALQRDLLAEVERRMQAREAQHTRENTTLLDIVEKARTAAVVAVQEVEGLQQQLQREQAARIELEQRLKQLQAVQASQPAPTTARKRGGKKTAPGDPQA